MIRRLLLLALLPVAGIVAFAGLFFFYNRGNYSPPPSVDIQFQEITSPSTAPEPIVDSGTSRSRGGLLVIDDLHENSFRESEIVTLSSWVANRGYDVEIVDESFLENGGSRFQVLEEMLRRADSFLVMFPLEDYTEAEVDLVERFVDKGGKLGLVSDPTRPSRINILAKRFDLEFRPDYLYNTVEYDRNFRHIFIRDFQPDALTNGLDTIALYIAGSVRSPAPGLAATDANTKSSLIEAPQDFYPIAWGDRRNVLAVGDFTFMVPPYDSVLDNDRLLSNLADYLTDSQRRFELADFPHFFKGGSEESIDVLLGRDSLWSSGVEMRNGLAAIGVSSRISSVENVSRNSVFLGLYDDAVDVRRYLQAAGIVVEENVTIPNALELNRRGTAITLLHREENRYVLLILGDTPDVLSDAVNAVLSGRFRRELVNDLVGVR